MSTRKPVHPILRLMRDLQVVEFARDVKKVRRHVRPLLDALERSVDPEREVRHDVRADRYGPCDCADCRLLARWRAK